VGVRERKILINFVLIAEQNTKIKNKVSKYQPLLLGGVLFLIKNAVSLFK
jgi:hypothetical protein